MKINTHFGPHPQPRCKLFLLASFLSAVVCALLLLAMAPAYAWQAPPPPDPPATYYGQVQAGSGFTPTAGMTVTAWVTDTLCGQAQTQDYGQIVYAIDVQADWAGAPGCGAPGREIRFKVDVHPMSPHTPWDNSELHELDLQLDLPVAVDDGYITAQDVSLKVGAPGVLSNDDDVGGPSLMAIKDTDPTTGTLALNLNGSFVYTPTSGFDGVVNFTYHANNGTSDSNVATVIITVTSANVPPQFTSTPITVATEDVTYTYAITATDANAGDVLVITAPDKPAWLALSDHEDGTATLSGTPGRADVGDHHVKLQVRDTIGATDTQSFSITVASETVPPTVTGVSPEDGATDVVRNAPIVVNFDETMLTSTVNVLITPTVTGIVETWGNGDTRLTLNHDDCAASTRYTATVTGSDLAGNSMVAPYTWVFTTGVESAPEADLALGKVREGSSVVTAGNRITYTFTITNIGPTSPVTATVVDTFYDTTALDGVSGSGCAWPGAEVITCTVTGVVTNTSSVLTLVVTTSDTYSDTLVNYANVAPTGGIADPNEDNNNAGPVAVVVRREEQGDNYIYLPLVLRDFG